MNALHLTLILITQIHCEWVEISQHYNHKKPVRPTHNHPFLTTTRKVDVEKTTSRNRIYLNHSVPDFNFNSGNNKFKEDSVINSAVKFKDRDEIDNKRPESDSNKNMLIIKRRKPENKDKIEEHNNHENSGLGKGVTKKPLEDRKNKPLEEYKEPIEVMDLSELEYTTAYDIANNKYKRKEDLVENTSPQNGNRWVVGATTDPTEGNRQRQDNKRNPKPPLLKTNNMRRVNIIRSTSTQRTPTQQFQEENYETNTPGIPTKSANRGVLRIKDKPPTTPNRFSHVGHVKRVNITNTLRTTPKSTDNNTPAANSDRDKVIADKNINSDDTDDTNRRMDKPLHPINIIAHKTRYENQYDQKVLSPDDIMVEELLTEDEAKTDFKIHKGVSIGNVHRIQNPADSERDKSNDKEKNKVTTTISPEQDIDTDVTVENEDSDDRFNNFHRISTEQMPSVKFKSNDTATEKPDEVSQIERYQPNPYKPVRPSSVPVPEFVTKDENFVNGDSIVDYETTSETSFRVKPTEPNHKETEKPSRNDRPKDNNNANRQGQVNENKEQKEDPISDKTKPSAIENLIKFLKTVTEIISRNSRRGVLGKVRYLEDLRDTILANIEERLEEAFPDDSPRSRSRRRAAEPRGHVEFPSSESALMTISFLTFAVFLIKLILQVIHAYKNKTMMVMPTVISAAVGRAFAQPRTEN